MAGIGQLIENVRREFALYRTQQRKRFDEVENRLVHLEELSNAQRAPESSPDVKRATVTESAKPKSIERPTAMKEAEVGVDPR